MATAMEDLKGKQKAFIVTDSFLFEHTPHVHELVELLKQKGIGSEVFHDVQADPNLTTIRKGTEVMNGFQPDLIIAIGGGSPSECIAKGKTSLFLPQCSYRLCSHFSH
jgi:acetaldehyde dehydrogenase/alcohol dehydrogenase